MTAPIVTPGYWCECRTRNTMTGDAPLLIASIDVETATQAVRWIRIALRALIPTLDAEAFDTAWDWLSLEYRSTVQALTAGEPRTFTITQAQTTIQWTVRPVHFLKLATRQGINLPPAPSSTTSPHSNPSNNFPYAFKAPRKRVARRPAPPGRRSCLRPAPARTADRASDSTP